jgi:hypothetical protein
LVSDIPAGDRENDNLFYSVVLEETREGCPMMNVKTEVNGDSKEDK